MTPREFSEIVLMLCRRFNLSMTSGYRTVKRNAEKDGHPKSRHLLGLAIDVVPDDWAMAPAAIEEARRQGIVAIHEDKGTTNEHIHFGSDG